MKFGLLAASLFLLTVLESVQSYGTGAPDTVCVSMQPNHGAAAQTSASPYQISVSSTTVKAGEDLTVTIQLAGDSTYMNFKGFLLQGQNDNGGNIAGSFKNLPTNVKGLTCTNANGGVTHNDSIIKIRVAVTWTAPQDTGSVRFRATVVNERPTFWTDVQSVKVEVTSNSNAMKSSSQSVLLIGALFAFFFVNRMF